MTDKQKEVIRDRVRQEAKYFTNRKGIRRVDFAETESSIIHFCHGFLYGEAATFAEVCDYISECIQEVDDEVRR